MVLAAVAGFAACGGEVMVGEVDDADIGTGGGAEEGTGGLLENGAGTGGRPGVAVHTGGIGGVHEGGGAPGDCSEANEDNSAPHERWVSTPNDFGELAGTRWKETSFIPEEVLIFELDGTGRLEVGDPVTPVKELGHLDPYLHLQPGATLPLHGTTFDGSQLLVPLPERAPWEAWCSLQDPISDVGDPCVFGLRFEGDCQSDGACVADGRDVDDSWWITSSVRPCTCVESGCFAYTSWPEWEEGDTYADHENYYAIPTYRLTYDAASDSLKGGFFRDGIPPEGDPVEFVRVE